MTTKILMHPKPMRRHTSRVKPAIANITVALPADCETRKPGIYIELGIDVGPDSVQQPSLLLSQWNSLKSWKWLLRHCAHGIAIMTYHKTQFRQNADLRNIANRRAEAAYSIATAVMIGLALAGLAVAWGLSV